jgi:hypothetical protein
MKNKRLVILGQGRSGSTLIQRILHCSIRDSFICGENNDFWYHIYSSYQAYKRILRHDEQQLYDKSDNYKPCWFHPYKIDDLLDRYRELFDKMYYHDKSRLIGFKEIRFPKEYDELCEYVNFFKLLFPDIIFIITVRDTESLVTSGWWAEDYKVNKDKTLKRLEDVRNTLVRVSNNNDNIFLLRYEDMTNLEELRKLFSFIGEDFNLNDVKRVINKRV